jgi:putative tryptophan/tyrosine transport system substrate-binding protein
MRRRDFTMGLLLAGAAGTVRAQQPANQHRIAIVISTGPVARINDPASRYWQAFWDELRRLGDIEGQNLIVERYSGEGRPAGFADLARQVVSRNPDVIVAIAGPITLAVSAHRHHTDRRQWDSYQLRSCAEPRASRRQHDGRQG